MDHQPRSFSAHEMQILSDLAAIVEDEFKVLDAATSDELTGLFNRRGSSPGRVCPADGPAPP
ncbi:hypothetical protein M3O75_15640 [Klebsiella pneumoniae]|nr:hypothetical protein [Klebsiella pneumoniae]